MLEQFDRDRDVIVSYVHLNVSFVEDFAIEGYSFLDWLMKKADLRLRRLLVDDG